jgi:hypothetical protein
MILTIYFQRFGLNSIWFKTLHIRNSRNTSKYPLSALLFVFFSVEIMALRIKKEIRIA